MTIIDSGRTLNGKHILLKIEHSNIDLKIQILIPDGYKSNLTKKIMERGDIRRGSSEPSFGYVYLLWEKEIPYLKDKSKTVVFMPAFYVYAQQYLNYSTKEENKALRGMGRIMLCNALKIGISNRYTHLSSLIYLEADGGDAIRFNRDRIKNLTKDNIMKHIRETFPDELEEIQSEYDYDFDGLLDWFMNCLTNMNLVEFYKKIGFIVISDKVCSAVPMYSNIETILRMC